MIAAYQGVTSEHISVQNSDPLSYPKRYLIAACLSVQQVTPGIYTYMPFLSKKRGERRNPHTILISSKLSYHS